MTKSALHFGAGNIGRGFIGALLAQSGYTVTFADIAKPLIDGLNTEHAYDIHILDVGGADKTERITGVSGVMSNDPAALTAAIASAAIITTAVGPAVLKIIARSLAAGITARREAGSTDKLNIIACENMTKASAHLHDEVLSHLKSDDDKAYLASNVGFPSCAVDRIVPPFTGGKNVLSVGVEAFFEWIVESPAFAGPPPEITGMKLTDNLVAYVQRKLFTLNCGHATCAYLGNLRGYATVDEALADPEIEAVVRGAMKEAGAALCKKYDFDEAEHAKYIEKIMNRFRNPYIKDDVGRVGRDPLRKLGPADRLVGPLKMCQEYGLPTENLLRGIAAALWYDNKEDKQSVELRGKIAKEGVPAVVKEDLGLGEKEGEAVQKAYKEMEGMKK
ncbi:mannitol dehydrogenase C-terminal domain-containing protein [Geopyxis carbonaria]|nr:mannitol dehydrogenase C-terminal domain-containing protein [Geopyxis carbonaria]